MPEPVQHLVAGLPERGHLCRGLGQRLRLDFWYVILDIFFNLDALLNIIEGPINDRVG